MKANTLKVTWALILGLNILSFQNCAPSSVAQAAESASQSPVMMEDSAQQSLGGETNWMTPVVSKPPPPTPVKPQVIVDKFQITQVISSKIRVDMMAKQFPANVVYLYSGGRLTLSAGCQFSAFQMSFLGFTAQGLSIAMKAPTDIVYNQIACDALYYEIAEAQNILKTANEYQVVSKNEKGATVLKIGSAKAGWVVMQKAAVQKIPVYGLD